MTTTVRQIIGVVIAAIVIIGGAAFVKQNEAPVDRKAVFEACMASIPGSATNFADYQTCTDKANAAR